MYSAPLALGFLLPQAALAQEGLIPGYALSGCDFTTGVMTAACIPSFIGHTIQFIFSLVGVFFVINIIVGGYQIAMGSIGGGGNQAGKDRVLYSAIGFAVTVSAFLIFDLALTVFTG